MLITFSEENKKRIRLLAQELRIKHKSMDWDVPLSFLIEKEGLDYNEYDLNSKGFKAIIKKSYKKITKIIKAALFVKDKIVLIDKNLHPKKKPFGKAHELGHHSIPEHREILYACSEHDLNPQVQKEMEFEANLFASETIFPTLLMHSIYKDYPVSMETILQLAKLSDGSFHSAAIRYADTSDKECCLLILDTYSLDEENKGLRLKRQICSKSWWKKYGNLIRKGQLFPANHNLSLVAFSGNAEDIVKNMVKIKDLNFHVHTFYNNYNVFALIF